MARVTDETVAQVASLARLSLTPEERATFAAQLERILAYADSIQALDTERVAPMSHAGSGGELREDDEQTSLPGDEALAQAPDAADGLFRVPRVIP